MAKLQFVFFVLLLVYCCEFVLSRDRIEVTKCTKYKKNIYEKKRLYGAYMPGAENKIHIEDKCKQPISFIVNGEEADPKEFPPMARLGRVNAGYETKWFCGGTLISEKFVLSAAHCLESNHGEVNLVRLGELVFDSTSDDANPEDFEVKDYIIHPKYDWRNDQHDIGLVKLKKTVAFDYYKHPACLPVLDGDEFADYIAIGWGSTNYAASGSKALLKVNLARFSSERCDNVLNDAGNMYRYKGLDTRSQLCAGSIDTRDTCSGDSGGPLLAYHREYPCMYFVVGVTSFGTGGCGTPNVPGLYTRVYNYVDWINDNIWK